MSHSAVLTSSLETPHTDHTCMAPEYFVLADETVSPCFMISVPKALRLLKIHKIQDDRFRSFLVKWAYRLLAFLAGAYAGFNLLPIWLAVGGSILGACLFAALLWLEIGDILLEFAREDKRFFQLATACSALSIVENPEPSLPQPTTGFAAARTGNFKPLRKCLHPAR
jgi:hypothetical protein